MLNTYRYLRGGMAVMMVMLSAAVLVERRHAGYWLSSISQYYYSPARSVFVAALCALGILLISYRGSTPTEGALLNLAGILAFVVAFVPTSKENPVPKVITSAICNNITALVIAFVVARLLSFVAFRLKKTKPPASSGGGFVVHAITWLVAVVGLIGFIWFRKVFDDHAHLSAAITMFGVITLVVLLSARHTYQQDPINAQDRTTYFLIYLVIATYMVASAVVVSSTLLFLPYWQHRMLVIEILLIVGFTAYWSVQTLELWNVRTSLDLAPEEVREEIKRTEMSGNMTDVLAEFRAIRGLPMGRKINRLL